MAKLKYTVRFLRLCTGYVHGSNPPAFDPKKRKMIEACGSSGQMQIDGRLSLPNMRSTCKELARLRGFAGYRIYREPARRSFAEAVPITEEVSVGP